MAERKTKTADQSSRKQAVRFERMFAVLLATLALVLIVVRSGDAVANAERTAFLADGRGTGNIDDGLPDTNFERIESASVMFGIGSIMLESGILVGALGLLLSDERARWFLFIVPVLAGSCAVIVSVLGFVRFVAA